MYSWKNLKACETSVLPDTSSFLMILFSCYDSGLMALLNISGRVKYSGRTLCHHLNFYPED